MATYQHKGYADISEKKNDSDGALYRYSQALECFSHLHSWKQMMQCVCYEKISDLLFEEKDYVGAVDNIQKAIDMCKTKRNRGARVPKEFKSKLKHYKSFI